MKKRKCKILTLLVGCALLASCVSDFDVDKYLIEKENALVDFKKEDKAIREDLEKEIIKIRSEMQPKIDAVKDLLSSKVDGSGNLVISALADSVAATGTRINERVMETKDFVDEQMTHTKSDIETSFVNLETKRQTLNTQLQQAIAQSNDEQVVEINKRLDAIDQLETMANVIKTKVESLESNLEASEALSQQMKSLEERRNNLNAVFNDFDSKINTLLDLLEEEMDEEIETLKSDQIYLLKSYLADAESFLDQIRQNFDEIDPLISDAEEWLSSMEDLESMINDMINYAENTFSDVGDYINDMQWIMDIASDLESDVEDFLSRLDDLDGVVSEYAAGEDPSGIWDDFVSTQEDILALIQTTYDYDNLLSELYAQAEQAIDDFDEIYTSDAWK